MVIARIKTTWYNFVHQNSCIPPWKLYWAEGKRRFLLLHLFKNISFTLTFLLTKLSRQASIMSTFLSENKNKTTCGIYYSNNKANTKSIHYAPGTVLSILQVCIHFIFTANLWGRCYTIPFFSEKLR